MTLTPQFQTGTRSIQTLASGHTSRPSDSEAARSCTAANGEPTIDPEIKFRQEIPGDGDRGYHRRVWAMLQAGRHYGAELDPIVVDCYFVDAGDDLRRAYMSPNNLARAMSYRIA